MTASERLAALSKVTEDLLDKMQQEGWWCYRTMACEDSGTVQGWMDGAYLTEDRPIPWDINCGQCEEWACEASRALGGGEVIWIEEYDEARFSNFAHAVLLFEGRFYDSETLEGADDIAGIRMVEQQLEAERRCGVLA